MCVHKSRPARSNHCHLPTHNAGSPPVVPHTELIAPNKAAPIMESITNSKDIESLVDIGGLADIFAIAVLV